MVAMNNTLMALLAALTSTACATWPSTERSQSGQRYAWATDDACWEQVKADEDRIRTGIIQSNQSYVDERTLAVVTERDLRDEYKGCLADRDREQRIARAEEQSRHEEESRRRKEESRRRDEESRRREEESREKARAQEDRRQRAAEAKELRRRAAEEAPRKAAERRRATEREKERLIHEEELRVQCDGTILTHEQFLLGRNPYADKGKCVRLFAATRTMTGPSEGLFNIGSGQEALVTFAGPFRGYAVRGVAKILGADNTITNYGDVRQVAVLKMIEIERIDGGQ
jgi:hypothetical protein